MDKKKTDLFENYAIPKAVAYLSLPAIMGTLVMVLYNMADIYFVGMLDNSLESSAVTIASPLILAFNAVTNLFGVGGSSLMSRSLGKKDYDTTKKCVATSVYLALFSAILFSALYTIFRNPMMNLLGADASNRAQTARYLFWTVTVGAIPSILNVVLSNMVRGEGESFHASIGVISGCVLNIILDPFFVLPKFIGMGAAGAGMATCISNCVACAYLLIVIFLKRKTTYVCLNPKQFSFRKDIYKEIFGVGIPASIQNLLNVTGTVILNNFTNKFGTDAVTAMGICHRVTMIPLYLTMGMTQGIMPLISYNFASGNRKRMKDAIMFVIRISVVITVAMAIVFYFYSGNIVAIFMDEPVAVVDYGRVILRAMCIGIPFLAVDFTAVAVFQAIGKGSYSFIFAISRKIILEIPAIIILNKIYPLYGMGFAQPFAEFVLTVISIFMLRKIFRETINVGKQEVM
ncbi:MAG: MATE family efflux transporter [Lachnospiraceae bacterium]|nr:MATE family efflux transporter [Lachnospiraceae bacterium]